MKKGLIVLVAMAALVYGISKQNGAVSSTLSSVLPFMKSEASTPEAKAMERVEKVMSAWKKGGTSLNDSAQTAACQWGRGVTFISDKDDLQDVAHGFDKWRREKNLFVTVDSYAVGTAVRKEGNRPHTVVPVTINGSTYKLGVPDDANPIFWTN